MKRDLFDMLLGLAVGTAIFVLAWTIHRPLPPRCNCVDCPCREVHGDCAPPCCVPVEGKR